MSLDQALTSMIVMASLAVTCAILMCKSYLARRYNQYQAEKDLELVQAELVRAGRRNKDLQELLSSEYAQSNKIKRDLDTICGQDYERLERIMKALFKEELRNYTLARRIHRKRK